MGKRVKEDDEKKRKKRRRKIIFMCGNKSHMYVWFETR